MLLVFFCYLLSFKIQVKSPIHLKFRPPNDVSISLDSLNLVANFEKKTCILLKRFFYTRQPNPFLPTTIVSKFTRLNFFLQSLSFIVYIFCTFVKNVQDFPTTFLYQICLWELMILTGPSACIPSLKLACLTHNGLKKIEKYVLVRNSNLSTSSLIFLFSSKRPFLKTFFLLFFCFTVVFALFYSKKEQGNH